jgi:hypothetical protein
MLIYRTAVLTRRGSNSGDKKCLMVFENRALRRIFGPKRDEKIGCRKLQV